MLFLLIATASALALSDLVIQAEIEGSPNDINDMMSLPNIFRDSLHQVVETADQDYLVSVEMFEGDAPPIAFEDPTTFELTYP